MNSGPRRRDADPTVGIACASLGQGPRAILEGRTASVSGADVAVSADSICVHSDTPGAVEVAKAVYNAALPHLQKTLL
jgi:lactam utilization protein B